MALVRFEEDLNCITLLCLLIRYGFCFSFIIVYCYFSVLVDTDSLVLLS
ncbi:hypothetical protein HanXRQr2_Chr09g0367531 [Helianthus annuus]|uniref:Uncharacterized protein n=1 Tax=Helianthus annuus TaxID=4232 RepID=A0A9K3I356_HELAN|nr:hypothetical protein HanXRQr2_Chr09g0367531 [Helianthus annuus]KAJ0891457.1 hypothetical protein HanPSC8_Chr09g0353991 [Helianthus annuus]